MTGPLGGFRVVDLSTGVAGAITTMLLADQGADVVKVEPPGGDRLRTSETGARVWARGKRSVVLDLDDAADRDRVLALCDRADAVVESFPVGHAATLGLDWDSLRSRNPRLVLCSITAYGRHVGLEDRPAIDALVAARTGLHFEQRGWVGTSIGRLCGLPVELADLDIPPGCADGPERDGPLFPQSRWPSLGAAYLATTGVRQRPEDPHAPGYLSWIFDPRGSKGHFRCADGTWVQNWVPNPAFALGVSRGDRLSVDESITKPSQDPSRIGPDYSELVALAHYHPEMAAAFARFDAADWVATAAEAGVPLQAVRSPEAALCDAALIDEGMVTTVDDPEVGPIRHVGRVLDMSATPGGPQGPAPTIGQHTAEVLAELDRPVPSDDATGGKDRRHPLEGVVVLDLGLAIAGPFGTQLLSDLGATVVKVNTTWDMFWHSTHIAFTANRGKQSIAVDLKDPRGLAVLHRLVARADVVQHNMRYEAAVRLGVDYESLRRIKPDLVYCHTSGFDRSRAHLPGNDQTGACLAGVEWEDGGLDDGGKPLWSLTSFGDTGNGFLSAIGMIGALLHRDRTGEGQFVSTSILGACLVNTSYAWVDATTGAGVPRAKVRADQLGTGPRLRLWRCADRWLCVAVQDDGQWQALAAATGVALDGLGDDAAIAALDDAFVTRTAADWFATLDGAGVPCEIADDRFAFALFDDPVFRDAGLVTSIQQAQVGRFEQFGDLWTFSDTPSRIAGPPLVVGHDTVALLEESGMDAAEIESLLADKVVVQSELRQERAR